MYDSSIYIFFIYYILVYILHDGDVLFGKKKATKGKSRYQRKLVALVRIATMETLVMKGKAELNSSAESL